MSVSDFLAKAEANSGRRSRKLDHLELPMVPEIWEPTQAEFAEIRAEEEALLGKYRDEYRILESERDAAGDDKVAKAEAFAKISDLTQRQQEAYELFKAKYALYSLAEYERKPTDDEVKKLQTMYSAEVIEEFYQAMLSFSRLDKSLDELKKT